MPVFWFEDRDTIIHRMNPVLKVWLYLLLVYMASVYTIMEFRIPVFIFMNIFALGSRMPKSWWAFPYVMQVLAIPWDLFFGAFAASPTLYARLPLWVKAIHGIQFTSPDFMVGSIHIGVIGFTGPNMYLYFSRAFLQLGSWVMLLSLIYTISPSQQLQMLANVKAPSSLQFIWMLPWRYASVMAEMTTRVYYAQTLRGYQRKKSRNPFTESSRMMPLMMPLIRVSVNMIDEIAVAAESRAFGTGPRGPLYDFGLRKWEWGIIIPLIILLAVTQYYYWFFKWGTI